MDELLHVALFAGSVLLAAAAASLLGHGLYQGAVARFVAEVREESRGLRGVGTIVLRKLGGWNHRLIPTRYASRLRRKLVKAGEPRDLCPEDVLSLQELGLLAGTLFGLVVARFLGANLLWSVAGGLAGGGLPLVWLNDQVKKRHAQIARALPYNLDLLTLAVEAGLDFIGAVAKVVEKGKGGPLRDELALVLRQLKMGKTRQEALRSMIVRVDLPTLTTFVTALIQADRMGTSLGKVLRIQSTQLRIDRTQRAEKLAAEAPVKMLLPLIGCIFPTVFLVLFGPIVFAFLFGGAMG